MDDFRNIEDFESSFANFLEVYEKYKDNVSHSFLESLYKRCISKSCKSTNLINFFHDRKVDLNLREQESGSTGLVKLARREWIEPFKRLLELGADPNLVDVKGFNALDYSSAEFAEAILKSKSRLQVPVKTISMFQSLAEHAGSPVGTKTPLLIKPAKVIVYDDPIRPVDPTIFSSYFLSKVSELGIDSMEFYALIEKLQTSTAFLDELSSKERTLVEYLIKYDVNSYHGEMVSMGFIRTGLDGANFLDLVSSSTDGVGPLVKHSSADFGLDVILDKFRSESPDVISNSSSPKTKNTKEKLEARKAFSEFADEERIYFVTSAGNEGIEIQADFKYSDYYFIIAAVDGEGKLVDTGSGGSNYGDAHLAAPSYLNLPGYDYRTGKVETSEDFWGATSYSTPQVASLIGKALNRLPLSFRHKPSVMKEFLVATGDYSQALEGKIENPVVINEQKALEALDSNLFFEVLVEGDSAVDLKVDRRLDGLVIRNNKTGKATKLASGEVFKFYKGDVFTIVSFQSDSQWGLSYVIVGKSIKTSVGKLGKSFNKALFISTLN